VHWTWDTCAVAASAAKAIVLPRGDSWFFLTADFVFGYAMRHLDNEDEVHDPLQSSWATPLTPCATGAGSTSSL
jgi:hypothetical protein